MYEFDFEIVYNLQRIKFRNDWLQSLVIRRPE
jgi:hypothetical protein